MKKKIKKAFTLVELLVVIAILAILATVSIVGYNSFTKKAKVSNDTVLVKQMNDILFASKQTDEANPTMEDAISDVLDGGYDLDKLTPTTAGYNIVWDSKNDQMVLLDENMNAVYPSDVDMSKKYNYFAMVSGEEEITSGKKADFSHYLKDGFTTAGDIETSTGIDVGRNTNINTITYTNNNEESIIIRTNSFDTIMSINAKNNEVSHYGDAKEANILNVKKGTYNEYGRILGNINIAYGYISLKDGSSVSNVVVKELTDGKTTITPTNTEDFKVSVENNASINMVISEVETITVPVEGKKASSIPSITKNENKAYIGKQGYTNFSMATQAAKDGDTITLLENTNNFLYFINSKNEAKSITLDLNGFDFSLSNASNNPIAANRTVKIKNGNLIFNGFNNVRYAIDIKENAFLTLENVNFETDAMYALYLAGNGSKLNLINSTITAIVGIATDNTKIEGTDDNKFSNNANIVVDSSKILAAPYSGQYIGAGILLNVAGNIDISNSYIEGGAQGIILRSGTANISNSIINAKLGTGCNITEYSNKKWDSGTNVMHGTLILGDWSKTYNVNVSCTLKNTTITSDNSSWESKRLIVLSQDGACKTSLVYDELCNIQEYYINDIETAGLTKGIIEVNGQIVRAADSN